MDEINRQKSSYYDKWKQEKIPKKSIPIEQINVLIDEERKRFKNDYYQSELIKLKRIFSVHITDANNRRIVQEYQEAIRPEIDEIFYILQEMKFINIITAETIRDTAPESCQYQFSKLAEVIEGDGYPGLISMNALEKAVGEFVNLKKAQSYLELYVVIQAGFWKLNQSLK